MALEEIKYTIEVFGTKIGKTSAKGWTKELNKVSWGDRDAKWDIREWNEDHTKCSKGITLTDEELSLLGAYLFDNGLA